MTKLIVEESLRKKLINLDEEVELCDETGHSIGFFYPRGPREAKLPPGFESPYSDEELQRRMNEPGGHTLAEIWAELDKS
jgi:hypothetical protein